MVRPGLTKEETNQLGQRLAARGNLIERIDITTQADFTSMLPVVLQCCGALKDLSLLVASIIILVTDTAPPGILLPETLRRGLQMLVRM